MNNMNDLAERYDEKRAFWSLVFAVVKWVIIFNAGLFALYQFTPINGAFTLVYGMSPANIWYCIGVALLLSLLSSTAHHRAHGFSDLAKHARGEVIDTDGKKG